MLLMIAAWLAAAQAVPPPSPARAPEAKAFVGEWRINQMEMGGGLELSADGRFRYALSYGAADEEGTGRWELLGDRIALTSDPMPVPPAFALVKDEPAPKGELWVKLEPPGFGFEAPLELWLGYPGRSPEPVRAGSDGQVSLDGQPYPRTVVPQVPIYGGYPKGEVALDPARGHRLTFRFVPNDVGKAAFNREPLMIDGETLTMVRFDTRIRFRKVTP